MCKTKSNNKNLTRKKSRSVPVINEYENRRQNHLGQV